MQKVDLNYAFGLQPKDAIAYFRSKGYAISDNWWEVWQRSHAKAFTVAKAMRMDVLEDIRTVVDKAISEGLTAKGFYNELAPELKKKGWWGKQVWVDGSGNAQVVQLGSARRLNTIYRQNIADSYNAAHQLKALANAKNRPYWMYIAVRDSSSRPSHSYLHGRVFRYDDPIWDVIYPTNGINCRCTVRFLTEKQVQRMGLTVENGKGYMQEITVELTDKRTGEIITKPHYQINLPDGRVMRPDVGFAYNPGKAAFGADQAVAAKIAKSQSIELKSQLIQSLNNSPLRQSQYASWAGKTLDARRPGNSVQALGFMTPSIQQAVTQRLGREPTALLAIGEKQLIHADSSKHNRAGTALSRMQYLQLPAMLAAPQAVLWDNVNQNLLYIYPDSGDSKIKIVINTGWNMKKQQPLDTVINTYKVAAKHLTQQEYELLEGNLGD